MPAFDYNTLMRQVRKMQTDAAKKREELAESVRVEGKAGDGLVTAVVNGVREVVSIKLDPKAVDPADLSMLEDLIVAAVNQGLAEAKKQEEIEMQKISGGVKIPGLSM
jgi:DNA-binding YbaB/EbfC family protein